MEFAETANSDYAENARMIINSLKANILIFDVIGGLDS